MAELSCEEAEGMAAELALGILEPDEAAALAGHLLACPPCRASLERMSALAAGLAGLAPAVEPPLGFDERVLSRRRPPRRRLALGAAIAVAAAVVAVVVVIAAPVGTGGHRAPPGGLSADLHQGLRVVGTVRVGGDPPWVTMDVRGSATSGPVTCQLIGPTGTTSTVGSFDLVRGSGSWSVPEPAGLAGSVGARLVTTADRVVATASWKP